MRTVLPVFLVAIGAVSLPRPSRAQDALLLRDASTLPRGKTLLWESLVFVELTHRYDFERERFAALDGDNRGFTALTIMGHGVSDRLEILLHLPFQHKVATAQEKTTSAGGLGDLSVQARMGLVRGRGPWPSVVLSGLVRLPSGDDDGRPALGDGTTDYAVALILTESLDRLRWHLKLGYYVNGKTPGGVEIGDSFLYMLKVDLVVVRSTKTSPQELAVMLGVCGRLDHADTDRLGRRLPETRQYRPVNIVPMVRWTPVEGLAVRPRVVVPIRPLAEGGKIGAVQPALDVRYSF
jgi:hypothetical protein